MKRVDRNQKEIVAALRKVGCTVTCTHMVGKGFPDIVVGYQGENYLFEIKDCDKSKSRQKMTKKELEWHDSWHGQKAVISSFQDAVNIICPTLPPLA